MANYISVEPNKWYYFARKDGLICCDCSLVHTMQFKIKDKKIYIKFDRDDRATAGYRRSREVKKNIKDIAKKL